MPKLPALLLLLLPAACASVTSGTTQAIDVATEPPGASCVLSRNGAVLGRVSPTPGSVTVDKSGRAIELSCTREGYEATAATVDATLQPMTAGNILVGGVIGVVVDASTGAMHRYPGSVSVPLLPASGPVPAASPATPRGG